MTTTGMFSGLGEDERKSSRVLKAPGGGSSNIFGTEPVASEPVKQKPYLKDAGIFGSGNPTPESRPAPAAAEEKDKSHNKLFGDSPSGPAKSTKPQGAYNPITGAPYATAGAAAEEKSVPSTRVRQPPGGASSKLW